jgi:hypothetical protein
MNNKNNKQTPKPQKQQKRSNNAKTASFKTMSAPVAKSVNYKANQKPRTMPSGSNIRVRHTEYIFDVTSTTAAFTTTPFAVNPGQVLTFPWLSKIAGNYESYKIHKLDFFYKPICPTSTPGKIMLAMDYDATDMSPQSKVIMMSYESAASASVWNEITQVSKQSNLLKFGVQRYVRTGAQPANTDLKTYDVGKFYVATSNTPATPTTLGELYVCYDVELITPQLNASLSESATKNPTPPEGASQFSKIATSVAGAISMVSDVMNAPLFCILQAVKSASGVYTYMDIAVNPNIVKPIRFDLCCNGEDDLYAIGKSSEFSGKIPALVGYTYPGAVSTMNIFTANVPRYQRSFAYQLLANTTDRIQGAFGNSVPGFRLKVPVTDGELFLNAFTSDTGVRFTEVALANMPAVMPILGTVQNFVIDWAKIASATYENDGVYTQDIIPPDEVIPAPLVDELL